MMWSRYRISDPNNFGIIYYSERYHLHHDNPLSPLTEREEENVAKISLYLRSIELRMFSDFADFSSPALKLLPVQR